jgi:hypothetical protein
MLMLQSIIVVRLRKAYSLAAPPVHAPSIILSNISVSLCKSEALSLSCPQIRSKSDDAQ